MSDEVTHTLRGQLKINLKRGLRRDNKTKERGNHELDKCSYICLTSHLHQ